MPDNLRRSTRMVRRRAFYVGIALVLAVALLTSHTAAAQSCTAAGPALTLGTVNPYAGTSTTTSGTGSYNCVNPTAAAVTGYACVSVGTGTGGTSTTNRTLASGTSKLPISITAGGGSGQIGNGTSYPMYGPIIITIAANGSKAGTFPLAVTLPPPISGPPPGSYTSNFATTDAQFIYYTGSATTTCASLNTGTHLTTQADFSVSATMATQCTVASTSMAFPISSVLTQPKSATATVSVTCNSSIPVTIGLDNGATGSGPTARQMKSGVNAITYGIYRDVAANLPWGNTAGTNTASLSSGTGTVTAYGQVPAQVSPPPGSYADVVNVIITY
jgi:spore coat protein U-like protein